MIGAEMVSKFGAAMGSERGGLAGPLPTAYHVWAIGGPGGFHPGGDYRSPLTMSWWMNWRSTALSP